MTPHTITDAVTFIDPKGREVFVAETEGGFVAHYRIIPDGQQYRLKHRYLPVRHTRAQAETDLDLHAAMEQWRRVR